MQSCQLLFGVLDQSSGEEERALEGRRVVDGPDLPGGIELDRGSGPARMLSAVAVFEEDGDGGDGVKNGGVRVAEEGGEVERVDKVGGAAGDGGVEEAVKELVPRWRFKVPVVFILLALKDVRGTKNAR